MQVYDFVLGLDWKSRGGELSILAESKNQRVERLREDVIIWFGSNSGVFSSNKIYTSNGLNYGFDFYIRCDLSFALFSVFIKIHLEGDACLAKNWSIEVVIL